jgi:hypothetical protein
MSPDATLTATPAAPMKGTAEANRPALTIILVPVTEEAQRALGGKAQVRITEFPFKVGRESRSANPVIRIAAAVERRLRKAPEVNDLYLVESPSPYGFHISREHFAIERLDDSSFVLIDRNSACGTRVGDRAVGADSKDIRTTVRDGDLITLGTSHSPYVFQIRVSGDPNRR